MLKSLYWLFLIAFTFCVLSPGAAKAQAPGTIAGAVTDANQNILPGAQVKLIQADLTVTTDQQGNFLIPGLAPGSYTLVVTYVGFSPKNTDVTVAAGQVANLIIVLQVAAQDTQIIVSGGRGYGEAEAINETFTSPNIVNILPDTVIASLPNANVADAVGRLPGVTLERDEGEGKYVQIRGTEPRLSNLTIDGVEVPSPEGGIRQVKLDVVPADLVESVQIYKTFQANQDADAIGGSVNLVTRTAGDRPTAIVYGLGGFTPIIHTVPVGEVGATLGKRFGADKRFGIIISGSYDYNGRGINDVEPVPYGFPVSTFGTPPPPPNYLGTDIRLYKYNRNRYGFGGSADYKVGNTADIYVRGLFSDFKDSGRRWAYTLANNDPAVLAALGGGPPNGTGPALPTPPSFNTEIRDAHYQVGSLLLGGSHVFEKYYVNWGLSASLARLYNPINGGETITSFSSTLSTSNCQYDPAATKTVYRPQWTPVCYTEAYDPTTMVVSQLEQANHGQDAQLNLQAQVSAGRLYHLGSHSSQFEIGFRIRNAHKFDNSFDVFYLPNPGVNLPMSMFLAKFNAGTYYDGSYPFGPLGSWDSVNRYFHANPGSFSIDPTQTTANGSNPANFDLVERVTAGYVMNTIDLGRFTLYGGLRFEGTQFYSSSVNTTSVNPCTGLCVKAGGTYVDVLPSASLRYKLDNNSAIRAVYSRTLSRPLPSQLTTAVQEDTSTAPSTFDVGAVLNPEHSNNYDLLYERYLTPLGLIQAGFFYKDITSPIVTNVVLCPLTGCSTPQFAGHFVATPENAGSAYVTGLELAFQQHFTYLPGLLRGLGVSGNYSYTTSGTTRVNPFRTDNPALLRQAPNTWNLSPTYDIGRLSIRVGMAYNGANIFQYFYQDLVPNSTPPPATLPNPQPGGAKGPFGDIYLYSHFQIDAQGTYRVAKHWEAIVSGLNLNNAPFGFYFGSPQYPTQREYYRPTISFGFRWDLQQE
jgi:TonB-dependent receptor